MAGRQSHQVSTKVDSEQHRKQRLREGSPVSEVTGQETDVSVSLWAHSREESQRGAGRMPRAWKFGRPLFCLAVTLAAQRRPRTSHRHKELVEAGLEFRRRKEKEKKTG